MADTRGGRGRAVGAVAFAALAGAALGGGAYLVNRHEPPPRVRATLSVAQALEPAETAGYARAMTPRAFAFPSDHGPHPDYRTEWWYYAGNLDTAEGRHFGFQLTFFRVALAPGRIARASAWGATHVYMAHLAVTDAGGGRFHAVERVSRGAMGLAGATAAPFRVWLEDWSAEGRDTPALPMRLVAADDEVTIDLTLESLKPPVLHGDRGLSQKGAQPGNASYHYSLSRMPTHGTIRVGSEVFEVRGLSWMDREWSTSALGRDQVGWDWLALQLSDGREVMMYQLRRRDGSVDPLSRGTLVRPDGSTRSLDHAAVQIEVLAHWSSPRDGVRYPSRWRLRIPVEQLDLGIAPYVANQELDLTVRYWEGAVRVEGTAEGTKVGGSGYVELTGYAEGTSLGSRPAVALRGGTVRESTGSPGRPTDGTISIRLPGSGLDGRQNRR